VTGVEDAVRDSYDRVAERYAAQVGGELAAKPLDRALLRALTDLVADVDEATGGGTVADLGCGPGHVAAHLTKLRGVPAVGIDLAPGMVEVGRRRYPEVEFRVGSLLDLPARDAEFLGAVALYSLIHLPPEDLIRSYGQCSRVIQPGGWLLVGFHTAFIDDPTARVHHLDEWWGEPVDLDFHLLDPDSVSSGLTAAGFTVMSRLEREPWPGVEAQTRRCYLLCRR
jgi:ubiquinone/menaquinone biosynthesis C-methylase UbiE